VNEQPENEQPGDERAPQAAADAVEPAPVAPGEPEAPVGPTAEAQEAEAPVTPAAPQSGGEPAADEPAEPAPADETSAPEAPAASETPAASEPAATEAPATSEAPAASEAATSEAPAASEAPATSAAPTAEVPVGEAPAQPSAEDEDFEPTPRQRPEIPGADLIPDIVPEGQEFLDAEAQAAAEAEAEALAAREQEQAEDASLPIADAAIDLAAGARYTSTGKRKTAVARVILKPGDGTYTINGKTLEEFFPRETLQRIIRQPLETVGYESRMDVVARMHGGGVSAQAGALRHGISRALIVADPNLRGELKRRGFLTRDPRVKERKKAGLKKARKRPQFSKR
jgi:small subunit ribosomal protein S9